MNIDNRTQNTWSSANAAQRLSTTLERIASGEKACEHVFGRVFTEQVKQDLARLPEHESSGLSGALVSVKALLDVAGEVTHSGTRFLADAEPALTDAPVIARLREAGALLVGHTHMSELAYSGLGPNPHYGTADNPQWPGCTPGGSTAGGAVSVATGLADIAIGSDTGGSLRIPAAFCGITGFKPTQSTVSRVGTVPLSDSLDSIGPMARDVSGCSLAWQVMAGVSSATLQSAAKPLQLHVARNFGFDGLDPLIAEGFDALLGSLADAGVEIVDAPLDFLEDYHEIAPWKLTSVECRAHFEAAFQQQAGLFDPRVYSRMARADELSAVQYREALNQRLCFAERMSRELAGKALLLPTVAILPPTMESLQDDGVFTQMNLLALRNTTLANIGDGCSLALPYDYQGTRLSAMLIGASGADASLLRLGSEFERHLRKGFRYG